MVVDTSSSSNNYQKYKTFDDANNKDGQTEKIKNNANSSATWCWYYFKCQGERSIEDISNGSATSSKCYIEQKIFVPPKQILMENDPLPVATKRTRH